MSGVVINRFGGFWRSLRRSPCGRVAVVDRDAGRRRARRQAQGGDVRLELLLLVLLQRAQREQQQRARLGIGEAGLERGQRIHQRLSARGRRREHDVAAAAQRFDGARLVPVERADAARAQHRG